MERLTEKGFKDKTCIPINCYKVYEKLAEFEDFMEEYGFNSIDDLKEEDIITELQAYRKAWKELKKFVRTEYQVCLTNNELQGFCELKLVETKMQELEPETEGKDED